MSVHLPMQNYPPPVIKIMVSMKARTNRAVPEKGLIVFILVSILLMFKPIVVNVMNAKIRKKVKLQEIAGKKMKK